MRGRELLEKMELVSPVYVDGADETPIIRAKRWPKAAVAAACLCLAVWGAWGLSGGFGREPGYMAGPGTSGAPEASETPMIDEQPSEAFSEPPDETLSPEDGEAMAALREVLAGNATLIHVEQSGGGSPISVHEIKGVYIPDLPENAQISMDFTVLDLDGDGVREAAVKLDGGVTAFEILHVQDGTVCGSLRYIRSFNDLKADGTFWFSSSAADHGFGRLSFDARGYAAADRITYSQSEGPGFAENMTYVVDHRPATEAEYCAAEAEFFDKEPAEWHALTQENLAAVFGSGEPSDVASIAPEPCPDTLGFTNCVVLLAKQPEVTVWWYYALADGQYRPIACTFGMGDEPDAYRADLDGDGIDELICNTQWTDGTRQVLVYHNRDGQIEHGRLEAAKCLDEQGLALIKGLSIGGPVTYYDPEQGFVLDAYCLDENGQEVRHTEAFFGGLEHFAFETFEIHDGDPLIPPPDAPVSGG